MAKKFLIGGWLAALGLMTAAVIVWWQVWQLAPKDYLTVAYLDVGQGDATLVTAPNGNRLLIDGGDGPVILPALAEVLPIYDRRINVLLASHPHTDHIGGLPLIIERFVVEAVIDNGLFFDSPAYHRLISAINQASLAHLTGRRGLLIHLDQGVVFVVLFPDRELADNMDLDDGSLIGQLIYGQTAFMFTGDAGQRIERYLITLDGANLASSVLKAGHHGSQTSTAFDFVGWVNPAFGVISAGANNPYGHPHSHTIDALGQFDVQIESTADTGTIIFSSNGQEVICLTCQP